MTMSFTIPGDPFGKGSVRVGRFGAFKDKKTDDYMTRAIIAAQVAWGGKAPMDGPVSVRIDAYLRRPKYLIPNPQSRKPQPPTEAFPSTKKPDVDNIAKGILDALTQAGVITDDSNVVRLAVEKWWQGNGAPPECRVTVASVAGGAK
jgi:Holliday junction resolvase RusA-like endonuclease